MNRKKELLDENKIQAFKNIITFLRNQGYYSRCNYSYMWSRRWFVISQHDSMLDVFSQVN